MTALRNALLSVALLVTSTLGQNFSLEFDERWITRAPENQRYTFSVLILMSWTPDLSCTGSLLSPNWVLTAARCLYQRYQKLENDTSLTVYLRAADRLHLNVSGVQKRSSSKVIAHMDNLHSVALVQLDRSFDLDPSTDIASLTTYSFPEIEDRYCESISYGARVKDASGRKVSDKFISDQEESAELFCEGDFGAGLICDGDLQGVCVGTVTLKDARTCSIAEETSTPCKESKAKAVFLDICFYLTWLKKNLPHVHVPSVPCEPSAASLKPKLHFLLVTIIMFFFLNCTSFNNIK